MKRAIWKFEVKDGAEVGIVMPIGARVLSVQVQGGTPVVWAIVDPAAPKVRRAFCVVGTGWEFDPTGLTFVGTFQLDGGALVFHLFEREKRG